jgi:beta-lactamase superfamily II metal-dependent hydrolase
MVKLELVAASVGRWKEYRHPSPETIAFLERLSIPCLRTDRGAL